MNRKKAREFAMKCLFQMEAQHQFQEDVIDKLLTEEDTGDQKQYVVKVLSGFCQNKEQVDQQLNQNAQGWPVSRMAKTDLAVARLAVTEILFMDDVPKAVAINEAVELAKTYGTEQSSKFVNAVLKNIEQVSKTIEEDTEAKSPEED